MRFQDHNRLLIFFKQRGLQVFTNDFLNFNHQIGLSLIENSQITLSNEDIEYLLQPTQNEQFNLMQNIYTDIFFTNDQAQFLDSFRANIENLENPYKKALGFTIMNRSLTRKVTMGHFAHLQALKYANDEQRLKRNPSLAKPIRTLFLEMVSRYNQAVFDNQQHNKSFNQPILILLPTLSNIDLIYFDPPYCNSHVDYQNFYHLLETYTNYWKDKQFINATKRYEPQIVSGFDKKTEIIDSFNKLFKYAQDIPHWLMSYNNRSYPDIETLVKMIKKYKDVSVESKTYLNGRGGKGSVAGSQEILLVCKNKVRVYLGESCYVSKTI